MKKNIYLGRIALIALSLSSQSSIADPVVPQVCGGRCVYEYAAMHFEPRLGRHVASIQTLAKPFQEDVQVTAQSWETLMRSCRAIVAHGTGRPIDRVLPRAANPGADQMYRNQQLLFFVIGPTGERIQGLPVIGEITAVQACHPESVSH